MAVLKDVVLTTSRPQIEIKTINIKTITVLFSRQDSDFCTGGRFESNSMTISFRKGNRSAALSFRPQLITL